MWNADAPYQEPNREIKISVERILYSYDGPQIFTSSFGIFRHLFIKVEEEADYDIFIACQINDKALSLIVEGKLSVKSAFEREIVYVIRVNSHGIIERYWTCLRQDIPEDLLPKSHTGLAVTQDRLPNSALQIEAYFAMNFEGRSMSRAGMPFSIFKKIIDNAYEATRKILAPPLLAKSRSATFDFQVTRPQFSSLVVALETPIVNEHNARRAMQRPEISAKNIVDQIDVSRSLFFEDMSELVSIAEKNQLIGNFASERFFLLDNIHDIIPTSDNKIENLELNANMESGNSYISVDEGIGNIIYRAHKAASNSPIHVSGPIFLINASSRTFSIFAKHGREITCALSTEAYSILRGDNLFKTGTIASVTGNLTRRARRDYLIATGLPALSVPSTPSLFD